MTQYDDRDGRGHRSSSDRVSTSDGSGQRRTTSASPKELKRTAGAAPAPQRRTMNTTTNNSSKTASGRSNSTTPGRTSASASGRSNSTTPGRTSASASGRSNSTTPGRTAASASGRSSSTTPERTAASASGRATSSNGQRRPSNDPRRANQAHSKEYQRRKEERRRKRKRQLMIQRAIVVAVFLLLFAGLIFLGVKVKQTHDKKVAMQKAAAEEQNRLLREEEERQAYRVEAMSEADKLALNYDYDAAIEKLQSINNYQTDDEVCEKLADIQVEKSNLVAVDMNNITHIFYHSLVVDPELAFAGTDGVAAGFKQWMTTIDEFDEITQQMYDNGYVLVSLYDLVTQTTDDDGTVHFKTKQLYLPEGKKPYVLSLDDLSYYHSYDGRGIASKMIIGEDGKPTCEYIERDGTVSIGAYDCVPRLDAFLEEHPDASYRGAKGTIALTGYNGILGYRTDIAYKTREDLDEDQILWLSTHPNFDWDKECEEAKKVAECIKADGWTFASHTWGHMHIGDASLDWIMRDTEKWLSYVAPLIGGTDMIIFAHGQDLGDWHDYSEDNAKFTYLKSKGFNFYCNVDSSKYFLQIRDNYVRQGRRNLDGYRLWNDVYGETNRTSDLIDATKVLDPARTDMPSL